MLRMSFDQDVLENVEERLSVWVHAYANSGLYAWLGSCIHGQASCVRGLVHACTCLFLSSCVHMFQPTYVCIVPMYTSLSLCAHTARQKPQLDYLNSFFLLFLIQLKIECLSLSFLHLNVIPTSFFISL